MTMLRSGLRLRTTMPCRRTSSGSLGSARATRFCTSTWDLSRLVPCLNVSESCITPSLEDWLDMYSMSSTPLISCSRGVATVSERTLALAPGKTALTWTLGGAISGYWAIGRLSSATLPTSTIKIEITDAKIGRSMKKWVKRFIRRCGAIARSYPS